MIRVVVVDDQPLARAGIATVVNSQDDISVVAEAANGEEALGQIRSQRPNVVLMDVRMPGAHGTDGIATARIVIDEGLTAQNGQPIKIIILTTFDHDEYIYAALRAGVSGFLLKDADSTEITTAIRAVAAGNAWLNPSAARLLGKFASQFAEQMPTPTQMSQLTDREREVLIHIARGQTNAEVAEKLSINETTVRTYVSHVITKLKVREKAQAVAAAYRHGLVKPPSD
ncbi:MAG: response regulator [Pseudonocardiaceae bacterium]